MKKFILFATLTFCILLLAGCIEFPNKEQDSANEHSVENSITNEESVTEEESVTNEEPVTETGRQQFSIDAGKSIDALREKIIENKAQFGIVFGMAYVGYFDSAAANETGIDFGQWFNAASSPFAAEYPFVSEIDENHTIGTEGHLYCIIVKDDKSSISVSRIDDDKPIYTSENGDPILLFCNLDGNAQKADTTVTINTADGKEYRWEPTLDDIGFPDLLIGNERELLSWDFTPIPNTGFDLDGWLAEGWGGTTAVGLAYDSTGTDWWISTWDNSVSYCLSFYLNEGNGYDGDVALECFYGDDSAVQAKWQGNWHIETEIDQPSRLYLDVELTSGADRAAFENAAVVSESYLAMVSQSGNNLLLVADDTGAMLPVFPEDVQAVELTLADVPEENFSEIKTENGTDESEPVELTYLRAKIKENDSIVGVAYCGFVSNAETIQDYNYASDFSTNGLFEVYPFFYTYPVSINVGVEMFAVVPASTQSHVTVYKVVLDNGEFVVDRDTVLYEDESGKPFVFICNDHEAYSNVLITVRDGDETVEVSPMISIENGDFVLGDGCYDFTVKDIRDYWSEAREYLTETIDEIKDGVQNGMLIRYDDEVRMYDHYALRYELGKYDESGTFNIAREYMIDDYYIMVWDEDTFSWRVVGKGFDYDIYKFNQAMKN